MPTLLVFDTETGGFDASRNAILSVGFVLWRDGKLVSELELLVRDETGVAEYQALLVNHIDLAQHNQVALEPEAAVRRFGEWLREQGVGSERIELVGHNIAFDVPFLQRLWRLAGEDMAYRWRFHHLRRCTMVMATVMRDAGLLPVPDVQLSTVARHFGLQPEGELHSALTDARLTARLYTALLEVLNPGVFDGLSDEPTPVAAAAGGDDPAVHDAQS